MRGASHVKFGDVKRGDFTRNTYKYAIVKRFKHPKYDPMLFKNDIALFKLSRNVEFNPYVRPICLPQIDEETQSAIATGWGALEAYDATSKVLMKVTLDIFNHTDCNQKFEKDIDYETQVCAGSYEKRKDTCGGDSGGPLQIYNKDQVHCMYTIIGITSFGGSNCGAIGFPGVYTRVHHYLDWIEKKVWPSESPSTRTQGNVKR